MTVAFVGVGAMGTPMARNVGVDDGIVVFDPDRERVDALVAAGATAAGSPREAAERAETIVVMVATPAQLDVALFGTDGVAGALDASRTVVVMSSVGVDAVRSAAERIAPTGALTVDAPVSGGVARAETGELTVFVGADDRAFARVEDVLRRLAASLERCGDRPGDGQAYKLVNQLLCSVHLLAAGEALALAEALGLDPALALSAVEKGAAASFMLSDRGPRMVAGDEPPVLSAVDIFVKDSSLVAAASRAVGTSTPLADLAAERFAEATRIGWGRRDDSVVIGMSRLGHPLAGTEGRVAS